jgi:hypothetical protein
VNQLIVGGTTKMMAPRATMTAMMVEGSIEFASGR